MQEILIKYSVPSKFCQGNYGSLWKQMHDGDAYTFFVQTSKNPEEPDWVKMSDFLVKVFENKLEHSGFIMHCLKEYHKE